MSVLEPADSPMESVESKEDLKEDPSVEAMDVVAVGDPKISGVIGEKEYAFSIECPACNTINEIVTAGSVVNWKCEGCGIEPTTSLPTKEQPLSEEAKDSTLISIAEQAEMTGELLPSEDKVY